MVERVHRQLKDALRAREAGAEWPEHLPWVLLGLRAAPKETTGISSKPLALPGELKDVAESPAVDFSSKLASVDPPPICQPRSYAEVAASNITISKQLQEAPYVYVRRGGTIPPLAPVYSGPFGVLHAGPKVFTLEVDKRLCQWTGSSPTPVHYQSFQQFQPREVDPRNKSGLTVLLFITLL